MKWTSLHDKVATWGYFVSVHAIGIKALKNRLSHYVRIASEGGVVLVTDRDRVVAELRSPEAGRASGLPDVMLANLAREGVLTPAVIQKGWRPRCSKGFTNLIQNRFELWTQFIWRRHCIAKIENCLQVLQPTAVA